MKTKVKFYYDLLKTFETKHNKAYSIVEQVKEYHTLRKTLRYIMHTDLYSYPLHKEIVKRAKRIADIH